MLCSIGLCLPSAAWAIPCSSTSDGCTTAINAPSELAPALPPVPASTSCVADDVAEATHVEAGVAANGDMAAPVLDAPGFPTGSLEPGANPEDVPTSAESHEPNHIEIHGEFRATTSRAVAPHYSTDPSLVNPRLPFTPGLQTENNTIEEACLSATYVGPFSLQVEGQYNSGTGAIAFKQYYLVFEPSARSRVTLGQFKAPFGNEGLVSDSKTMTIRRSAACSSLYHNRDLGIGLELLGQAGRKYYVAVLNGQGRNKTDRNHGKDAFLRFTTPVGKHSRLGISGQLGSYWLEAANTNLPVRRLGLDYTFRTDQWRIEAELLFSNGYNKTANLDTPALGGSLGCTYTINPSWDVTAFVDWFDPQLYATDHQRYAPKTNAETRWVIGGAYFLDREHIHKITVNAELHRQTEGMRKQYGGLYLQYYFGF